MSTRIFFFEVVCGTRRLPNEQRREKAVQGIKIYPSALKWSAPKPYPTKPLAECSRYFDVDRSLRECVLFLLLLLQGLVERTKAHPKYAKNYRFEKDATWIEASPCGDSCTDLPQVVALDCEMCMSEVRHLCFLFPASFCVKLSQVFFFPSKCAYESHFFRFVF